MPPGARTATGPPLVTAYVNVAKSLRARGLDPLLDARADCGTGRPRGMKARATSGFPDSTACDSLSALLVGDRFRYDPVLPSAVALSRLSFTVVPACSEGVGQAARARARRAYVGMKTLQHPSPRIYVECINFKDYK